MKLKVDLSEGKHHQARKLPNFIGHLPSLLEKGKPFSGYSKRGTSAGQEGSRKLERVKFAVLYSQISLSKV